VRLEFIHQQAIRVAPQEPNAADPDPVGRAPTVNSRDGALPMRVIGAEADPEAAPLFERHLLRPVEDPQAPLALDSAVICLPRSTALCQRSQQRLGSEQGEVSPQQDGALSPSA
jgi:hypothetical protein